MSEQRVESKALLKRLRDKGILTEQEYEAELADLAVQDAQSVQLGSGAIAQEGSKAAGERGVAAETNAGNVATGDHSRQVQTTHYIENQFLTAQEPDLALQAHDRYLEILHREHCTLPMTAMGGDEEASENVRLDQVYIDLDTQTQVDLSKEERQESKYRNQTKRPLAVREAVVQQRRLVLLGDPGSGKSTFVRQLVASLADARLKRQPPPEGWSTTPLPLFVILYELAPALAKLELDGLSERDQRRQLVQAVRQRWLAGFKEFQAVAYAECLEDALTSGDVLVVFDGLDEVPETVRPRLRQALGAVCQRWPNIQQIIVTCRIRSYSGAALLPDFKSYTLAPFDREKIRAFVKGWYQAQVDLGRMRQARAQTAVADLQKAALDAQLRELAQNPMLLTTMSIIHQREVGLPDERVRLYKLAVEVLLSRWQIGKGTAFTGSAELSALLKADLQLGTILQELAYRVHQRQAAGSAEGTLTRGELLTLLEDGAYLGDTGLAAEFLDYIDQRAGLLVGRGGDETSRQQPQTYSFPHRTFQEYLAGCRMLQGRSIAREYWKRAQEGDFWYLAAQFGAEELLYNRGHNVVALLDLAYDLCPVQRSARPPTTESEWRALLWSGHMAQVLGKEAILRDSEKPDGGQTYLARLIEGLLAILRHSPLNVMERRDAGQFLAKLGDPRIEVLDPLHMEFCDIPAGPFQMGSNDGYKDEQPQHPYDIAYDYQMARYPVTHAQFQVFVDAGGYQEPRYWQEAIAAKFWSSQGFKGRFDSQPRNAPYAFDKPLNLPNHPVVGVTWYEALAFTRWLTEQMHQAGRLPLDWHICLPNEPEWEKAARGTEGRLYPWGDEPNPNRANDNKSNIGHTNAVGCFPGGTSPYGVEEMSGNVWEWTRSLWGDKAEPEFGYPYAADDGREDLNASDRTLRVIRGGSWGADPSRARCGARLRYYPGYGYNHFGFRVSASPSTSGL